MGVPLVTVDPQTIAKLRSKLVDTESAVSLPEKYRILYALRNASGAGAHDALVLALQDSSALFRHDVAFCLGQRQEPAAVKILTQLLHDRKEHAMVRHEAAEALGAICTDECLRPLYEHLEDPVLEVAETCQLALQRIQLRQAEPADPASTSTPTGSHRMLTDSESPYNSVDPTPALPATTPVEELREILLDEDRRIFERYSAMFALRNKGGREALRALCAVFGASSALLKHEVAYVLGQMQDKESVDTLVTVLQDTSQHAMVRHEAAEALGAVADSRAIALLHEFSADAEPIVADSCVVALDMLAYEQSDEFQYAAVVDEPQATTPQHLVHSAA